VIALYFCNPNSNFMEPFVRTEVNGACAVITFFHPMSNSLPGLLLASLREQILAAGQNPSVRIILLKSEGERAFCGGASFEELASISDEKGGKAFFSGFSGVINAIRTCGKIVIGRIQGKAVGGGVGLAAAVDVCYATRYASIRLSELAVGIGPFVIGPAVSRKVGLSAFSYMSLTPDVWQDADWARQIGLYHEVFQDVTEMDQAIDALIARLAEYNPEALSALKKVFWEGTGDWDELLSDRAGISGRLVLSEFTRNAIAVIKNKNA
jgi:methylglutaconyl-CoA hydratase